jgi:hypothetical protein
MALMLAKLYTALREAGVDDVKAREAAEEVASFENRLANVEASLTILKWMVGFDLVLTIAIIGMLFFVLANEITANAAATDTANAGTLADALFRGALRPPWLLGSDVEHYNHSSKTEAIQ